LPGVGEDIFNTPELVRMILNDPGTSVRPNPVRIWMQPGGHRTLMHYDGNSICGLNLQVVGRKRWTLISPRTPIPCVSFNKVAITDLPAQYDPDKLSVFEFETVPGDLLYLPRYWFHRVAALESVNINVNWVWTPVEPDPSSPVGRREVELLKLARMFPGLDRFMFDDVVGYGGGSPALVDRYIEDLSAGDAVKRLLLELGAVPRTLLRSRRLMNLLRRFKRNNFNVHQ
jgi:hypothetical protein